MTTLEIVIIAVGCTLGVVVCAYWIWNDIDAPETPPYVDFEKPMRCGLTSPPKPTKPPPVGRGGGGRPVPRDAKIKLDHIVPLNPDYVPGEPEPTGPVNTWRDNGELLPKHPKPTGPVSTWTDKKRPPLLIVPKAELIDEPYRSWYLFGYEAGFEAGCETVDKEINDV